VNEKNENVKMIRNIIDYWTKIFDLLLSFVNPELYRQAESQIEETPAFAGQETELYGEFEKMIEIGDTKGLEEYLRREEKRLLEIENLPSIEELKSLDEFKIIEKQEEIQ